MSGPVTSDTEPVYVVSMARESSAVDYVLDSMAAYDPEAYVSDMSTDSGIDAEVDEEWSRVWAVEDGFTFGSRAEAEVQAEKEGPRFNVFEVYKADVRRALLEMVKGVEDAGED